MGRRSELGEGLNVSLDAAVGDAGGEMPVAAQETPAANPSTGEGIFVRTIEELIVPQLLEMIGHVPGKLPAPDSAQIIAMAEAAVGGDTQAVLDFITSYRSTGASSADALLYLVAPAARHLGDGWTADTRDFVDVTVGLGTLHRVVSQLSTEFLTTPLPDRRILLGPTPGEHHTLGLAVVDHFFRVARWDVDFRPMATREVLMGAVQQNWFGVVGLSLAGDPFLEEAAATVGLLRAQSKNQAIKILLGGPAVARRNDVIEYIGADAAAADGADAVAIANRWAETGAIGVPT
ncbi:MAG: cobalamin B12-binding domain-containing protein [Pseudomonadota bacterium]